MRTKRTKRSTEWWAQVSPWEASTARHYRASVIKIPATATEHEVTAAVCLTITETAKLIGVAVRVRGEEDALQVHARDRDVWLAEHGPTARDVAPATYAAWSDSLPVGPLDGDTHDEYSHVPFGRGVYLQLSAKYRRTVDLWAVDSQGVEISKAHVPDDAAARAQMVRTLWELLDRQDSQASDLPGGYRDGYGETIDDSADDFGDEWRR